MRGEGNRYLGGNEITIADYPASSYVGLVEVIGSGLSVYRNVRRWLARVKSLKTWPEVNKVIARFAESLKGKAMVPV